MQFTMSSLMLTRCYDTASGVHITPVMQPLCTHNWQTASVKHDCFQKDLVVPY